MNILQANLDNAEQLAYIISQANKEVAKQFNINRDNNPKHPSFYTKEWVLADFDRGEEYFLFQQGNGFVGCVAFEQPNADTAYLNRLAVLPNYQHRGIGKALVNHIFEYAKAKNIKEVSIGIIAEHQVLKQWYHDIGFIEVGTKKFEHLPFDVTFMRYDL